MDAGIAPCFRPRTNRSIAQEALKILDGALTAA
jgi:hypothetical protein